MDFMSAGVVKKRLTKRTGRAPALCTPYPHHPSGAHAAWDGAGRPDTFASLSASRWDPSTHVLGRAMVAADRSLAWFARPKGVDLTPRHFLYKEHCPRPPPTFPTSIEIDFSIPVCIMEAFQNGFMRFRLKVS